MCGCELALFFQIAKFIRRRSRGSLKDAGFGDGPGRFLLAGFVPLYLTYHLVLFKPVYRLIQVHNPPDLRPKLPPRRQKARV